MCLCASGGHASGGHGGTTASGWSTRSQWRSGRSQWRSGGPWEQVCCTSPVCEWGTRAKCSKLLTAMHGRERCGMNGGERCGKDDERSGRGQKERKRSRKC
eukprot:2035482-Pleurochrysis_carterae.AAC.1